MKKNNRVRIAVNIALAATLAVWCAGCAGYRLGTTLPPGIKTLYVPAFVNRTGEPQVDTVATRAAIQEIQRDGTLSLSDAASADAHLYVTVTEYKLDPLRYDPNRSKTAREYRLLLTAELEFRRREPEEVLARKKVRGDATFELVGDLATAKIEALPEAAADLAHDIVEVMVEYW
jgi:hypothetical protein